MIAHGSDGKSAAEGPQGAVSETSNFSEADRRSWLAEADRSARPGTEAAARVISAAAFDADR
jgi:hypothetical protein